MIVNPTMLNSIALFLDITGAILIFIGSEKLTNIIGNISYTAAERMGKWDSTMEPEIFKNYWTNSKKANKLSRLGIILLVLGFLGQLVASLIK